MGTVNDVCAYLEAQGIAGGNTGWTLLRRRMMDAPANDKTVIVAEDGGFTREQPSAEGIGDSALGDPQALVSVRAGPWDSDSSYTKAQEIFDAIHGLKSVTLGDNVYLGINAMTPEPVFAGFDEKGRPLHTISFRMLRIL